MKKNIITTPLLTQIMTLCAKILLINLMFMPELKADTTLHKQIVGATEMIYIEEAKMYFKARVDTGAKKTSIHAENIQIELSDNPELRPISFDIVNKKGQSQRITTVVNSIATVKTSEGSEKRYEVLLTLRWGDTIKTVLVNLNDRKKMTYSLLLGRNWLYKDFLVDVEKNSEN